MRAEPEALASFSLSGGFFGSNFGCFVAWYSHMVRDPVDVNVLVQGLNLGGEVFEDKLAPLLPGSLDGRN